MSPISNSPSDHIRSLASKIVAAFTRLNDCSKPAMELLELAPALKGGSFFQIYVLLISIAFWRQDGELFETVASSIERARPFRNPELDQIVVFSRKFFGRGESAGFMRETPLSFAGMLTQKFHSGRPGMYVLLPMILFLVVQKLDWPEDVKHFLQYNLYSIYSLKWEAASAIPGWACLLTHLFCAYPSFRRSGEVAFRAERVIETPASRLVNAIFRHVSKPTLPAPDAANTVADFRTAYDSGYLAFAGVVAGLALRDPGTAEDANAFLSEHPDLWVPARPALIRGPWEPAFLEVARILETAVKTKAAASAKRKRAASAYAYSWKLSLSREKGFLPENLYAITSVTLLRSRRLKGGGLSKKNIVRAKQVLDAAHAETLVSGGFPESLTTIALDIAHSLCMSDDFTVLSDDRQFPDLLARLQGDFDITLAPSEYSEGSFYSPQRAKTALPEGMDGAAVKILVEDLPLQTEYTPEGDLRLSIPIAVPQKDIRDIPHNSFCLADPGIVRVLRLSGEICDLYRVLRKDATPDDLENPPSLTLPAYAAKEASDRLTAAAGAVRMRGAISDAGDEATFAHTPADVAPVVRLLLDKDDTLHVSLRNRIHPKADVWCTSGRGAKSVAIPSLVPPVLADRDFAAENAAAVPVRDAMAPFAEYADGEDGWAVDDLESALNVLEALHSKELAVPVEWIPGSVRQIDLRNVASTRLDDAGGAEFWLGVKGDIRLDNGEAVRLSALLAALRSKRQGTFVRMGENAYLRLSKELMRRLDALNAAGEMKGETLRVNPAALPMLDKTFRDEEGVALPGEIAKRLARVREAFAATPRVPDSIRATLRPYQDDGFRWMWRLAAAGIGCCLADDMGLGKTLQTITLLQARAAGGPSLVVAPASVCDNWISELRRFAPRLQPVPARDDDAYIEEPRAGMVVVASYGLLQHRLATFSAVQWNGVVLDEAQSIKNAASKRARGVKTLKAAFRIAATGTPVENNLDELWSLFDFLNPGLLLSHDAFVRTFTEEGLPLPALKKLVKPLILRRLKRDVLDDLPEKTEITLHVDLSKEERTGYEACRIAALNELEQSDENDRIGILAQLMRLRRYCCLPELVLPEVASGAKMEALDGLLADLHDNQHRTLVFSQFVDVLQHIKKRLEAKGWTYQYLDGKTPAAARAKSVEAFQRGEGDFFLISLKAGGLGLNLTEANYVVLVDPWWNPAVENQAADRAHRIGQRHPVTVYRLVTRDTIEERVLELHARKKELAESLLEGTGDPRLTRNDLLALFRR